jgi:hypothetical protein
LSKDKCVKKTVQGAKGTKGITPFLGILSPSISFMRSVNILFASIFRWDIVALFSEK